MSNITRRSVIKSKTILAIEEGTAHNIVCNCENEVSETASRFSVDAGYRNYGQLADEMTGEMSRPSSPRSPPALAKL